MADIHILVADDSAGQRLDAYLGANDGCPTRSACAHLIEGGAVAVNGETCLSKKYAVRSGDRISVDLPEPHDPTDVIPEAIPLDIRYEDDYLIVLSKQRGLVCHPAHGHESGTLANALVYHCGIDHLGTVQGKDHPGIVHRLDRDTWALCSRQKTTTPSARFKILSARARSTVAISRSFTGTSPWTRALSTPVLLDRRATA